MPYMQFSQFEARATSNNRILLHVGTMHEWFDKMQAITLKLTTNASRNDSCIYDMNFVKVLTPNIVPEKNNSL